MLCQIWYPDLNVVCRWSVCRPDCQRFGFKVAQFPSQKQLTVVFFFPNLFIALGSPSSRYLIKSEEIMKIYPLPSNENYPGPKTFNVSGFPDFLSVASIK